MKRIKHQRRSDIKSNKLFLVVLTSDMPKTNKYCFSTMRLKIMKLSIIIKFILFMVYSVLLNFLFLWFQAKFFPFILHFIPALFYSTKGLNILLWSKLNF